MQRDLVQNSAVGCLCLISFCAIFYSYKLSLWELIRLFVALTGILFLLRTRSTRQFVFNPMFVALLCVFMVTQFRYPENRSFAVEFVASRLFLAVSFVLALWQEVRAGNGCRFRWRLSSSDKIVGAFGLVLLATYLVVHLYVGDYFEELRPGVLRQRIIDLASIFAAYFAATRIRWGEVGMAQPRVFVYCTAGALFVVASIGGGHLWSAYSAHAGAIQALQERELLRFDTAVTELQEQNKTLDVEGLTLGSLHERYSSIAKRSVFSDMELVALSDTYSRYGQWSHAESFLRIGLETRPESPILNLRFGKAHYEQGRLVEATEAFKNAVHGLGIRDEAYWSLGLVTAKRVRRGGADWSLVGAHFKAGHNSFVKARPWVPAQGYEVRWLKATDLFNEDGLGILSELTPYELHNIAKSLGWSVVSEAMVIGTTGTRTPVDILAYSAGGGDWSAEKILVEGVDVAPPIRPTFSNFRRGYNVVVLDAATGRLEAARNFDIWGNRHRAPDEFAEWIGAIPMGRIVIATIRNDAGMFITERVGRALRKFGANKLPAFRWSHAVIGVMGATPGTALEVISQDSHVAAGVLKGRTSIITANEVLQNELAKNPEKNAAIFIANPPRESVIAFRSTQENL